MVILCCVISWMYSRGVQPGCTSGVYIRGDYSGDDSGDVSFYFTYLYII